MVESNHKATLEEVFIGFTGGKKEMSNKEFIKCTKDSGLICKAFSTNDVDILFSKVKTKTSKVLSYDQFLTALKEIAIKKKVDVSVIEEKLKSTGGPHFHGTKTDYVKFHDDKTLYTGVYAKGGPTNVDVGRGGNISDISQTCDRSGSDVRGVKK